MNEKGGSRKEKKVKPLNLISRKAKHMHIDTYTHRGEDLGLTINNLTLFIHLTPI